VYQFIQVKSAVGFVCVIASYRKQFSCEFQNISALSKVTKVSEIACAK
jgi:hypothetical protein